LGYRPHSLSESGLAGKVVAARITSFLLLVAVIFVSGCAEYRSRTILISEGCLIILKGITAVQAENILQDWNLSEDCEVQVSTTTGK